MATQLSQPISSLHISKKFTKYDLTSFFFVKTSLLTEVSLQIVHVPTFTLRSIKCDLIGGLDKRILQRLQVREFKDDWPLRPVGASRVTQVPQKCDLHSEHCFCKIKKKIKFIIIKKEVYK